VVKGSWKEVNLAVKRMSLILTMALIMTAMMVASALPALAQGPPTVPPGASLAAAIADEPNPAIDIDEAQPCVTLDTPGAAGTGHLSDFPDGCSGLVP
jgi:hypothetical protein